MEKKLTEEELKEKIYLLNFHILEMKDYFLENIKEIDIQLTELNKHFFPDKNITSEMTMEQMYDAMGEQALKGLQGMLSYINPAKNIEPMSETPTEIVNPDQMELFAKEFMGAAQNGLAKTD